MAKKAKEVTIESTEHLGNGVYKITYSDGSLVFTVLIPQEAIDVLVSATSEEESDEDDDDDDEDDEEVSIDDMKAALIESGVTKKDLKKMSDEDIQEAYDELETEDDDEESDDDDDDDEDDEDSESDEDEDEDEESDDDDDEITPESLAEMDYEEMEDVCDDKDLDTDPDDFEEEEVEKLRAAIAKELGIKLPKAAKKGKK